MKTSKCLLIIGLVLAMGFLAGPAAASIQIGGHVYVDWDGTHTSTAKAYGYSTITATLYDVNNVAIATATTDASGLYKWAPYSGSGVGPYTVQISVPSGFTQTSPAGGITGITASGATYNFWIAPNTPPSVSPTSIADSIVAGGSNTEYVMVTAGSEPIAQANLRPSTTDPNCQVQYSSSMVSIPANTQTAAPGLSVTVTRLATAPAGTQCSFNLQVLDVGYTSGNNKVIATIPVTVTDPPVPVPEFPTVAVSILTLSGMFVAVQFLRKRN